MIRTSLKSSRNGKNGDTNNCWYTFMDWTYFMHIFIAIYPIFISSNAMKKILQLFYPMNINSKLMLKQSFQRLKLMEEIAT